ncbi:hypothetical protein BCP12_033 [Bacillus phage BCP12]|uniref:Uncharacterized protein n=1 Tax=Bacillus phage BCP12 TaxID=1913122 RepID=A0A2S0CSN9_9CAUD|nr:hypothetical protein BCP12_033 [Bacillus phage BCP12]
MHLDEGFDVAEAKRLGFNVVNLFHLRRKQIEDYLKVPDKLKIGSRWTRYIRWQLAYIIYWDEKGVLRKKLLGELET